VEWIRLGQRRIVVERADRRWEAALDRVVELVLAVCEAGDRGEKVTCWPASEDSTNLNRRQLGNLKLTDQEEDALVSFLKTLTDGYKAPAHQRQSKFSPTL